MKIRNCYVSNSSSSSFVVIKPVGEHSVEESVMEYIKENLCDYRRFTPFVDGEVSFGWDFIKYSKPMDKLNWACIQAYEAKFGMANNKPVKMLVELFNNHGIKFPGLSFDEFERMEGQGIYIDHQSLCTDKKSMLDIFETMTTLKNFLFCKNSFVCTGNDNEKIPDEFKKCYERME